MSGKNNEISNGVNLLEEREEEKIKPARKKITKIFTYLITFLVIAFFIFSSQVIVSEQDPNSWIYKIPIIGQIKHLAESADKQLKGEDRDRINLLLLGMGGKNHDGGYLTDTVMLASLEPSTKKVALLSIPRDLTIPMEGLGWRKINNVNAYAEAKTPGSGGVAISQALSDVLETPVDYFIRLDFEGFVNIINELGGIDVYVDNTLDDPSYPIMGMEEAEPYEARFEHLHIPAGWQKMDGELALKYVRSRHAGGAEGSDFARARRQQKVIEAAKNKFLSKNTLFRPSIITNILSEFDEHLSTNVKIWEAIKLWNMFKDVSGENITNKVLDNSANGLLVETRGEDGAYILTPRSGDFAEIQYLVNNIFSDAPIEAKTKVKVEKSSLDIRNGTWINGLASVTALDLEKYGFNVARISNCSHRDFQKSVIYDLTYGEKMESLSVLKEKTGANVSFNLPQWLIDDIKKELEDEKNPEQPDFILILGQDADKTSSGVDNPEK
ncbi:MAG: LCP family protein [Patescibacteria group bacterium]|nr:LCP family protein [Patescibacteria group bacterium]MDD5554706.1 LCP family protein [Patescibacteria group bacterium]